MRIEWFLTSLLVALVALNVAITYAVSRSDFYSSMQKTVQISLVWILPILGPVMVGVVLWSNYEPRGPTQRVAGGDLFDLVDLGEGANDHHH